MNNAARRLERVELAAAGYARAAVPAIRSAQGRRRVMEILAVATLRTRGEQFADFAALERARGPLTDAALLEIIGVDAPGFDVTLDRLREMRRGTA